MVLQKKHEVSYRCVHDFCDDQSEIDGRRWQVPEAAGIDVDPVMMNFKVNLQVVKTTKGTMQRLLASAQNLQATVDEQSEQVQLQCEQIHLTVEKLDEFIKRLRKNISKYDAMNAMSDVGNAITEMESLLSEAAAHNEGSTLVFQKLREIWPKTAS